MAVENPGRVASLEPEGPWRRLSGATQFAWRRSPLADLSSKATAYLLQGAVEVRFRAGEPLPHPPTSPEQDAPLLMVVSGLVRTFRRNGVRQVTTRYAGSSDLVGIPSVIRYGSSAHGEVVADAHVLRMVSSRLRELIRHDAASAWVVLGEIARLHDAAVDMACNNVFLSVRERVARHLLDLAAQDQPSGRLVVHASHQDIADAIGSVREVVSRVLREMKADGLVNRAGDTIVLLHPAGLVDRQR